MEEVKNQAHKKKEIIEIYRVTKNEFLILIQKRFPMFQMDTMISIIY